LDLSSKGSNYALIVTYSAAALVAASVVSAALVAALTPHVVGHKMGFKRDAPATAAEEAVIGGVKAAPLRVRLAELIESDAI
jgi:hypothetical protein